MLAQKFQCGIEQPVDEGGRLLGPEALGQFDGFAQGHACRGFLAVTEFVDPHAQDGSIHAGQAFDTPLARQLGEHLINLGPMYAHASNQIDGQLFVEGRDGGGFLPDGGVARNRLGRQIGFLLGYAKLVKVLGQGRARIGHVAAIQGVEHLQGNASGAAAWGHFLLVFDVVGASSLLSPASAA